VLTALQQLVVEQGAAPAGLVLLSGGTDGEDGPTDAAGAVLSAEVVQAMLAQQLQPGPFLARNDAYRFFEPLGALFRTGPTHTNVCDLRVVLTAPGH
jgi:glycerate 2-kinase